jgi:hypothetical protein
MNERKKQETAGYLVEELLSSPLLPSPPTNQLSFSMFLSKASKRMCVYICKSTQPNSCIYIEGLIGVRYEKEGNDKTPEQKGEY